MARGRWISVDGVEGVGKTTLVAELAGLMDDVVVVDEFTDDPVGGFLRSIVERHPHVYSESLIGQSLVFLGEFWQRYDLKIKPAVEAGHTVVVDRGYVSKYVYQYVVMETALDERALVRLLDGIFGPMSAPDLTIVLSAKASDLRSRLIARGEECDDERMRFIARARGLMDDRVFIEGPALFFDTSSRRVSEISESVLSWLRASTID